MPCRPSLSNASKPDLDGCVQKELILEVHFLPEGKKPQVDIELPGKIQVKNMAIGKVQTCMGWDVPAVQILLMALEMLISLEEAR